MQKVFLFTLSSVLLFAISIAQSSLVQEQGKTPSKQAAETASKTEAKKSASEEDRAIARTRRQVKMLDDVYKGGIVLITTHYVEGDEDLPAGTAFKMLFEAAKNKGWHEVRLVDATGEPYDDENVAISEFEKNAVKRLVAGEAFVDETITEKGQRFLLAATPIPVVMEKCTMCHSNYDFEDKGQVVGALTYRVPIDE